MDIKYTSPIAELEGDFGLTEVGTSERGGKILAWFMRDKIYDNKPLAVCREYIFNALDEHRKPENNVSRPITIHAPTFGDSEFRVRDYANGLSETSVRQVFGMLGESTKGAGDVGGFGIGAKVGNAYADSFFVESFFEGVHSIYQFFLAPSEKSCDPPVAKIAKIYQAESNEPSGILVRVPVSGLDIHLFIGSLKRVCFYIEGEYECNVEFGHAKPFEINGIKIAKNHEGQGFYMAQGGCVYKADPSILLGGSELGEWAKEISGYCVMLPMNSFDIVLSREHVENSVKSKQTLVNAICAVIPHFKTLGERLIAKGIFIMSRFYSRYRGLSKFIQLSNPNLKDDLTIWKKINVRYKSRSYFERKWHNADNEYYIEVPIPSRKKEFKNIWYCLESEKRKASQRLGLLRQLGVIKYIILDDDAYDLISANEIIKKALKNVCEIKLPKKDRGERIGRGSVTVEAGDINKAKFYLLSRYGKYRFNYAEHKCSNGICYEIKRLGLGKWVVVVPKSQEAKIKKAGLIPFTPKLGVYKRKLKAYRNKEFLEEAARCRYASMYFKHKGMFDDIGSGESYAAITKKIKNNIKMASPLWHHACVGGGQKHVYEEIQKAGLTNQIFQVK